MPRPNHRRGRCLVGLVALGAVVALLATACTSQETTTKPTTQKTTIQTESNKVLFEGGLYLQKDSLAARAAASLSGEGDGSQARAAERIAKTPVAIWLAGQYDAHEVGPFIEANLKAAEKQGTTPVFVTYAIPERDCGNYSAGGLTAAQYPVWTKAVAKALKGHRAVVIVEPDALSMLGRCGDQAARLALIKNEVDELAAAKIPAYLDAGNSHWNSPEVAAKRLNEAGIAKARGFFTNVASFYPVDDERAYAEKVSKLTGDSHYVIDVSRNGQGWKGTWCNPTGTGLGQEPHVSAGTTGLDALLWIKSPGVSDGTCNGGPKAGVWFASYAQKLVELRKQ